MTNTYKQTRKLNGLLLAETVDPLWDDHCVIEVDEVDNNNSDESKVVGCPSSEDVSRLFLVAKMRQMPPSLGLGRPHENLMRNGISIAPCPLITGFAANPLPNDRLGR